MDVDKLIIHEGDKYNHLRLCCAEFGNYVIQCIIKNNKWYSSQKLFIDFKKKLILDAFNKRNILKLSKNKFASNVMEKLIVVSSENELNILIKTICYKNSYILSTMINNEYANYILKTLFIHCSFKQKKFITRKVHQYVIDLYYGDIHSFDYGIEFLLKCRKMQQQIDNQMYY